MSDPRIEALALALRSAGELENGDRIVSLEQLAGGWSRHTWRASATTRNGAQRRYVVRVRPAGALLDTDLGTEYRMYAALESARVYTPRVFSFVSDDETPFGGPFIVMEWIDGSAPNTYGRDDQRRLAEDWNGPRTIARELVEILARIHAMAPDELPHDLPRLDFLDVVSRWRAVYDAKCLIRDPVVEEAFAWVAERVPDEPWTGLVHGDYRLGNTLIAGGHVRAVLDWELAYLGDARFDLGYLSIPRGAGKHLQAQSPLMGAFAELEWFLDRYSELTGRVVDADVLRTFQMLGIMMLLATQFTAVWMYAHGHTTDVRMAWARFSFAGLRQDMVRLMGW